MGWIWAWIVSLFSHPAPPSAPDMILSDGITTIKASARFGGAVYSLVHHGIEYIDSSDRGRLLQTAFQLNDHGEAENPTEGGSSTDKTTSSTQLRSFNVSGNKLTTVANLAYWQPYNGAVLSPHLMRKELTLGPGNVLHHQITISVVGDQNAIVIEGLTAYMPRSFTRWHKFVDGQLVSLASPDNPGDWDMAGIDTPIVASLDDLHAIGCYSRSAGYGYGNIEGWPKWDAGCSAARPAPAGNYLVDAYTVWGTMAEVLASLTQLQTGA